MKEQRFQDLRETKNERQELEYEKVHNCKSSKEIWDTLALAYKGKAYDNYNHITKIFRSLPRRWRPQVTTLRAFKDLKKLPMKELLSMLKVHNMELNKDEGHLFIFLFQKILNLLLFISTKPFLLSPLHPNPHSMLQIIVHTTLDISKVSPSTPNQPTVQTLLDEPTKIIVQTNLDDPIVHKSMDSPNPITILRKETASPFPSTTQA
ncbi:hypothetical protein CR513_16392, partial [Mucuna pruriens]